MRRATIVGTTCGSRHETFRITAAATTFHPPTGSVLVFGGLDSRGMATNDMWRWSSGELETISPPDTPSPRSSAAMTYDPVRDRVVLYGGEDAMRGVESSQTWEWDGETWELRSSEAGPASRTTMAYSPPNEGVLAWGGSGRGCGMGMSGRDWSPLSHRNRAVDRWPTTQHETRFDSSCRSLRVEAVRLRPTETTWRNGSGTERPGSASEGTAPRPFAFGEGSTVYSPFLDELLWLGEVGLFRSNDGEWSQVDMHAPVSRVGKPNLAYDTSRDRLVLLGGNLGPHIPTIWEWDATSTTPSPRRRTFDASLTRGDTNRLWLFGGRGGYPLEHCLNDVGTKRDRVGSSTPRASSLHPVAAQR